MGTQPVDFGLTSLNDFQSTFDGSRVQVSTTRDSNLENFSFNKDTLTEAADWLKFERNVGATAQVDRITVGGTVEAGDKFTVTLNGVAFNFTAADTSANNVAIGLANAINAGAEPVTAGVPSGGIFTLTADVAGTALTSAVATTESDNGTADAQTIATATPTANVPGDVPGGSLVTASSFAQVDTITVAGTVESGDKFTVTLNGVAFNFTAADTSANNVAIGLANAINAGAEPVTAGVPSSGVFTLTADVANTGFTSAVATTENDNGTADAQTIATVPTTLNVPGKFTNVAVGSTITISGTGGVNDGTFEVIAKTSSTLSIRTEQLTDEAANPVVITYQDPADSTKTITLNTTLAFTRSNNTMVRSAGDAITAIPVGAKITIASASTNNASFTVKSNDGTNLVVEESDAITDIPVGAKITIAGSDTNNASFTVKSNDGTNLVIETKRFTDQGTTAAKFFQFTAAGSPNDIDFVDGGLGVADTLVAPVNTFQDASGAALPAGTKLVIASTSTGNDGNTYTIASVSANKSTVTLVSTDVVTAAATVAVGTVTAETSIGTISSTSYFKGDQVAMTHRVDSKRDFEYDLNAVDPGFEKAIRAMKITLQGVFQTEGGLDQNTDRIEKILFLLNSALDRAPPGGTPPFGLELSSNIEQIEQDLGFDRVLIDATNTLHADLISFLDGSASKVENINLTEAIALLLNQQLALDASFQAFARIRQLSLSNFLARN